jgi:murein DD-endopeptidase MepM/ murein hydrolase activator NlpD
MKRLKQLVHLVLATGFLVIYSTQPAFAIVTVNDIDSIINQHWHYSRIDECEPGDPNVAKQQAINSAIITGENTKDIFVFLTDPTRGGLTATQAAGIMGNLAVESGFQPDISEAGKPLDGHWGYGLAQWTDNHNPAGAWLGGGRRTELEKAAAAEAAAKGVDAHSVLASVDFQIRYLVQESQSRPSLTMPGKNEWDGLKGLTGDVKEAVIYWEKNFERSSATNQDPNTNPALRSRVSAGQDILARYGSLAGTIGGGAGSGTNPTPTCTGTAAGGAGGNFRLPLPQDVFDKNPGKFTEPHHDYPADDIPVPSDTEVYAIMDGVIEKAPTDPPTGGSGCGLGVNIKSDNGIRIVYCHGRDGGMGDNPRTGAQVKAGDRIMHSDNTGSSTGPHLHVQIEVDGEKRCPQNLMAALGTGQPVDINFIRGLPASGCVGG